MRAGSGTRERERTASEVGAIACEKNVAQVSVGRRKEGEQTRRTSAVAAVATAETFAADEALAAVACEEEECQYERKSVRV